MRGKKNHRNKNNCFPLLKLELFMFLNIVLLSKIHSNRIGQGEPRHDSNQNFHFIKVKMY